MVETRLESLYSTYFQAQHSVDHRDEICTFHHRLEFITLRYTRIIHSRPWWNVYIIIGDAKRCSCCTCWQSHRGCRRPWRLTWHSPTVTWMPTTVSAVSPPTRRLGSTTARQVPASSSCSVAVWAIRTGFCLGRSVTVSACCALSVPGPRRGYDNAPARARSVSVIILKTQSPFRAIRPVGRRWYPFHSSSHCQAKVKVKGSV